LLKILKWIRGILLLAVGCLVGMCAAAGFPQMMLEYFHREIADNDGILFFIWLVKILLGMDLEMKIRPGMWRRVAHRR